MLISSCPWAGVIGLALSASLVSLGVPAVRTKREKSESVAAAWQWLEKGGHVRQNWWGSGLESRCIRKCAGAQIEGLPIK